MSSAVMPPPTGVTGGSYWGTTGTIPKQLDIPVVKPNGDALPALEAGVSPTAALAGAILFQAASDPGVDPVVMNDYLGYLNIGGYVYFATPINQVYKISNYARLSDVAFIGWIDQGTLPAVADVAYQALTPMYVKPGISYSFLVQGAAVDINGVPFAPGIRGTEPDSLGNPPAVIAYDATDAGASLLITFNDLY